MSIEQSKQRKGRFIAEKQLFYRDLDYQHTVHSILLQIVTIGHNYAHYDREAILSCRDTTCEPSTIVRSLDKLTIPATETLIIWYIYLKNNRFDKLSFCCR